MRRLGDLIARDAEKLAAIEVQDNGKLLAEMGAQVRYLPQWYYYYGGLADKIEGALNVARQIEEVVTPATSASGSSEATKS